MRIERINENKLRVFLSFDDLEDRDIDLDSFNYNTPETQELFWDLMEQAEVELGFDAMESQLCVEAVTDVDHGFVITITRMDDEGGIRIHSEIHQEPLQAQGAHAPQEGARPCLHRRHLWFCGFRHHCPRVPPGCHPSHRQQRRPGSAKTSIIWCCTALENPTGGSSRFEDILGEYGDKVQNTSFLRRISQ